MSKAPLYRVGQLVTVYHRKPGRPEVPIQMRGTVASFDGERLVLARRFKGPGRAYDSLDALQEVGDYGTIELRKRSWVCRRRYLRADGRLVGELFNIQTPTRFLSKGVEYIDLEIDVAYLPHHDEPVAIKDDADLQEAVRRGQIAPELAAAAQAIAEELARRLRLWDGQRAFDWDVSPALPSAPDLARELYNAAP